MGLSCEKKSNTPTSPPQKKKNLNPMGEPTFALVLTQDEWHEHLKVDEEIGITYIRSSAMV
jgi:hypothetical protein